MNEETENKRLIICLRSHNKPMAWSPKFLPFCMMHAKMVPPYLSQAGTAPELLIPHREFWAFEPALYLKRVPFMCLCVCVSVSRYPWPWFHSFNPSKGKAGAIVLHGIFDGITILFKEKNKWSNKSRPGMFLSFEFKGLINAFCMNLSEALSRSKRLMGRLIGILPVD